MTTEGISFMNQVEHREAITLDNQGQKIFAVLHRPLDCQHVPAIVICPGFGGSKSGKFRMFVTLAKELAKRGIAVLRFDYLGTGDSEGEFSEVTLEGKVRDTLICLNYLASDQQIDPSRIGILGRSLGGAIAILAASRFQTIKSLALWSPVFTSTPWRELWETLASQPKIDLKKSEVLRNLPVSVPNVEFIKQFFMINLAQELQGLKEIPLLHIHGVKDCTVKIEQAKEYERARDGLKNTRFVQLPEGDHDFSDPVEQEIAIQETYQWFKNTL